MEYLGPKLKKIKIKPFCKDFLPKNGFLKVEFKDMVVDAPKAYPNVEPFGDVAKDYVFNILKNAKEIYLESDKFNNLYDDTLNKRLLAWVWVDGKLLNYMLVKEGLAENKYIINKKMKYLKYLSEAYQYALDNKLGIHNIQ